MPRGPKARTIGMVALAKNLERSRDRIMQLRAEIHEESGTFSRLLDELQRQAGSLNGTAERGPRSRGARKVAPGRRRRGGQREAIVEFIKAKGQPQGTEAIASHVGNKIANVRQALMHMVKAGTLASFKKDGDSFRAPKKSERGGFYGLAS